MCCPKRFDTKPWAFACAYTTLLMYVASFLITIPFVFHKGMFDLYNQMLLGTPDSNPLHYVTNMGPTMYAVICFMCFGSLFVAFLSILCIIGIHKERSGFLIPYLVVKSIITLIIVIGSFFVFHLVRVLDETESYGDLVVGDLSVVEPRIQILHESLAVGKAIMVLIVLLAYWVFITPIVVVSTHCHRLMHGTVHGYAGASLIAMEAPPAQEIPAYHYAVKSAGAI